MGHLAELVRTLVSLIEKGQTLEAMERFYANEVTMQENELPFRIGKATCLEHERQMLAGVTNLKATLINQAINEVTGVVFSEWQYETTNLAGQRFLLTEVSVQHWQNERINSEKFYYNKLIRMP